MTRRAVVVRVLAALPLVVTGLSGAWRGPGELRDAVTTLQRLTEVGVLAYGGSGLLAGAAVLAGLGRCSADLRRRPVALGATTSWAVALVATGTLAPVAFGGASWWAGAAGGAATAAIAALVVWLVRRVEREERSAGASAPARDLHRE